MEIETKAFGYEQSLKWINSTVQTHSKLFKDGKLNRDDIDVTPINTEGGYLNRLDQLQNFTSQINHRVRALEVKSGNVSKLIRSSPEHFMMCTITSLKVKLNFWLSDMNFRRSLID